MTTIGELKMAIALAQTLDGFTDATPVKIEFAAYMTIDVQSMKSDEVDGVWCFVLSDDQEKPSED
jgi:hypothetical protein